MSDNLITIVRSEYQKKGEFFLFFPALAVEIGLNEGIPLETPIVKRVTTNLKKKSEQGYLRWNKDYPYDYDYGPGSLISIALTTIKISIGTTVTTQNKTNKHSKTCSVHLTLRISNTPLLLHPQIRRYFYPIRLLFHKT